MPELAWETGQHGYLQEVLAGSNESQLGAGAVRLGLASSHSLHQHRDLLCHHLPENRITEEDQSEGHGFNPGPVIKRPAPTGPK